jgi:hypothetical protein
MLVQQKGLNFRKSTCKNSKIIPPLILKGVECKAVCKLCAFHSVQSHITVLLSLTYLPVAGHRNKYMKMFIFDECLYTAVQKFFNFSSFSRRSTNTFLSSKGVMICCIVKIKLLLRFSTGCIKCYFIFLSSTVD